MSISPDDLRQVIRQAKRGNNEAISRLYEAYAQLIYRYIAYRVPESDAEDLTAEVFINMVEGLPKYEYTGAPFEAWLYRIAAARVADYHRQSGRRKQVELTDNLAESGPHPEERMLRQQELEKLQAAVQQLSEEQQSVIILRFVERKSHDEVAQILGKTVSNVKSIQHRALTRLAKLLGSERKIRHYLRGRNE